MQSDLFETDQSVSDASEVPEAVTKITTPPEAGVVFEGSVSKMRVRLAEPVQYSLGDVSVNRLIGSNLKLTYKGSINCISCGSLTNKSFSQGYCYRCFTTKAACDSCIMSPEKCHFDQNTCREPEWGDRFCMQSHYVYLANSSGIKVGITRGTQVPTRWIDQGACQALAIYRTNNRHMSGLIEVVMKQHVADKTNWRTMLKGEPEVLDLTIIRDRLFEETKEEIKSLTDRYGLNSMQPLLHADTVNISYPVRNYLEKISSFNFDKDPIVEGKLEGIKGQYLIFDSGVINLRRFTGYQIAVEVLDK
ncbi:DUF2797 domain-containing protein [Litoribacillus peritrichatus]|uniref:DUF2797 domain-containing protein n=1 Tax=Litoribacillus peritrichatus TaxID=718191 RepID=A0ABP7M487_9GAMM